MEETETPVVVAGEVVPPEELLELEPGVPPELEPEAEPTDPYAGLPTQIDVDVQTIVGNLSQYRQQLAAAKLAWHASNAGVPGLDHPNKIKTDIKALFKITDLLELFLHEEGKIPDPPSIDLLDKGSGGA